MRVVKTKFGETFIGNNQYRVYNGVVVREFVPLGDMNESELLISEELYQQNVLRKVRREGKLGYTTYGQTQKKKPL